MDNEALPVCDLCQIAGSTQQVLNEVADGPPSGQATRWRQGPFVTQKVSLGCKIRQCLIVDGDVRDIGYETEVYPRRSTSHASAN